MLRKVDTWAFLLKNDLTSQIANGTYRWFARVYVGGRSLMILSLLASVLGAGQADMQIRAFEWFDSFGHTNDLRCEVVCFQGQDSLFARDTYAFLLKENSDSYTVMSPELGIYDLDRTKVDGQKGLVKVSLVDAGNAIIRDRDQRWIIRRPNLGPLWFLTFSRAAALRGDEANAKKFFDQVLASYWLKEVKDRDKFLREVIEGCFSGSIYNDFGDTAVPISILETRLREFAHNFPGSKMKGEAERCAEALKQQAAYDQRRANKVLVTLEDRIQDAIDDLPHQNARQTSYPGITSVFGFGLRGGSPAERLRDIGEPALPALIAALPDQRPTRSTGLLFPHYESFSISAGQIAYEVIKEIAGRDFTEVNTWSQSQPLLSKQIAAWYADYKKVGARKQMIDHVKEGKPGVARDARALVERFPQDAPAAIAAALPKVEDKEERADLLDLLKGKKSSDVFRLVHLWVSIEKELEPRTRAAMLLAEYDIPTGVVTLQRCFHAYLKSENENYDIDDLIQFLVSSKHSKLLAIVAKELPKSSLDIRTNFVRAAMDTDRFFDGPDLSTPDDAGKYQSLLERTLVALLDDRTGTNMSIGIGDMTFDGSPIADLAAYAMSMQWPKKYVYGKASTRAERAAVIKKFKAIATKREANRQKRGA